nr:MAG TPA: hypothetical protein [Caudoviricetes sp.]
MFFSFFFFSKNDKKKIYKIRKTSSICKIVTSTILFLHFLQYSYNSI